MKKLYPWGWVLKIGLLELVAGSMRGSDDGRAFFAESKTNFTEGIFQMIASELPGSCWRILSYRKKHCEWIPAVMDVYVVISSANNFSSLPILDARFCTVVERTCCVLSRGWKSAFAEVFVFALDDPTAPTGVERWSGASSVQSSVKADEVRLGWRVGWGVGLIIGLVAESLAAGSLSEKSK